MKKEQEIKSTGWCCWSGTRGFPTFAVIILVLGIAWILNDMNVFAAEIPWFPLILVVLALGWIADHYRKK